MTTRRALHLNDVRRTKHRNREVKGRGRQIESARVSERANTSDLTLAETKEYTRGSERGTGGQIEAH